MRLTGKISSSRKISGHLNISRTGAKFYDELLEKPTINGVEVNGHMKGKDYGLIDELDEIQNSDIERMFNEMFKL